jgi:DNA-binding SARP family transcriptional activator
MSDTETRLTETRFSVLGVLSVTRDGVPLALGPLKQRQVLALLLCRANSHVPMEVLVDVLWPEAPPRTARKNIQVYVSALRRLLEGPGEPPRLTHRSGGYLLRVARGELDALRLRDLARAGREAAAAGDFAAAGLRFRQARELRTGAPLADVRCSPALATEADRLDEHCLALYEDWAEAELEQGNARAIVESLGDAVERHPLRERLRAARMRALAQSGRQAEALASYESYRQLLARELGLAPSAALERAYREVLEAPEADVPQRGALGGQFTGRPGARTPLGRTAAGIAALPPVLLPPDTADFTGRTELCRELLAAVASDATRSVMLLGPAGVGKTALAVHVAHRLREEFPDGRLMVRLRADDGSPRPWHAVLRELLAAAGLGWRPDADPLHAASAWRLWLADRKVLLVLDDAPDDQAVRALLPGGGSSAALVTSRLPLAPLTSARRVEVPPFTAAEARELLGRVIGMGRVRTDWAAADRIVHAVGLLPLAVRVCGLKLAVLRHMPLADYAARLADPAAVLPELTLGSLSVRDRLAPALRDLTTADRATLHRLAALPLNTVFTLSDAADALSAPPDRALHAVESLIATGLLASPSGEVSAHAALYEFAPLTHALAREALAEQG